ncbi:MAG: phosphoserine phosphatase SerB [Beijerinckiaceae bacterium]|nr:phosphoserine phosphatase SerB [Beijerinckiaceae bacterium]
MTRVATLVSNPASPALTGEMLSRARQALTNPSQPNWLDPGIAADIAFDPGPLEDANAASGRVRAALGGAKADVIVQELRGRRKKLLLADMDSTMIGQECIDELAAGTGKGAEVAAITARAMRGEIDFEPALRERVALLKGLGGGVIMDVIARRITLNQGALALVQTMRKHGAYTVLVSGGFSVFTAAVARRLGFDEHHANELIFTADGHLSGLVAEPILGRNAKLQALIRLREKLGLSANEILAVGDGANDLAMLEAAGLGVAFRAKPKVAAAAHARVDHGDLTALLYAQGFRREEFVTELAPRP